jgi:cytochrome c biogenesis protein CcmG, thiol:disulfide interchange protein DsbE
MKLSKNNIKFWPIIIAIIIIAIAASGFYKKQNLSYSPLIGKNIPEFSLNNITSSDITEPTIISFVAPWCNICHVQLPILQYIKDTAPHIKIYGIIWNDSNNESAEWLKKYGNPFDKIAIDNDGSVVMNFGVAGVPDNYLIINGKVKSRYMGLLNKKIINEEIIPNSAN